MELVPFFKYQGTGNDFIIIDNRDNKFTDIPVAHWCDRRFGIGADGLMLLQNKPGFDFEMVYYNSDGNISSMCGNGGRCISAFAHCLGLSSNNKLNFLAVDGPHEAFIHENATVSLKMSDVAKKSIVKGGDFLQLNTGSPHYVKKVNNIGMSNFEEKAKEIRHSEPYDKEGINVNFIEVVESEKGTIRVRTFERGVEGETLSCGTGVTACALSQSIWLDTSEQIQKTLVHTSGGILEVEFSQDPSKFFNIWLKGPAIQVFKGLIEK
jgi:diaminopimelate epimerase